MQFEWPFRNHTNEQLLSELRANHDRELAQQVRVLRILEEVDRRRLYAELGFPSLFQFCLDTLHLSDSEAYLRITVARAARRFPQIFAMIERGELHLTGVAKLSPHLDAENHLELLAAAVHMTKRQLEELIATRFPHPDVTTSIRRLPASHEATTRATAADRNLPLSLRSEPPSVNVAHSNVPREPCPLDAKTHVVAPSSTTAVSEPPRIRPAPRETRRDEVAPLSAERYSFRFTAGARCRALLDRARRLMSHRSPDADLGAVIEEALTTLVEQLEKKKFHTTSRARPSESSTSRHIPAAVKREVHARDGSRCSFVSNDGHRCGSCSFLEFDHIIPVAHGGPSTANNVRLLCRTHNDLAARKEFGNAQMDLYRAGFRPVQRSLRR